MPGSRTAVTRTAAGDWAKHNIVVLIAFAGAVATSLAVAPDEEYLDYFETRTLMCLFCAMAVICALDNVGFMQAAAGRVVQRFRTRRTMILGLVYATALAAMLISNDMALLTFLPLTYVALKTTDNERYLAFAFIMETAAANLGGMITPFGSPQNLFLYSHYEVPASEFFKVMAIPFGVSMLVITIICCLIKNEPVPPVKTQESFSPWPTTAYMVLFGVAVAIVFRISPVWVGFVVPIALMYLDRTALIRLDYGLLLTFAFFFVFSGNLARIESLDSALSDLLEGDVLLWGTLGSQVISNVPAAILFAQFTGDYRELLVAVNIGGVGTIVASLASLIALAHFRTYQPSGTRAFMGLFTVVNIGLLVVLYAVMSVLFAADVL